MEQETQYKDYGKQLLGDFWKIHTADFRLPLAVEYQFFVNLGDGISLGGKIDRIDKLDGGVSIVDYKTNKELFTSDHLEGDLQLTFYQLAVEAIWKQPVKKLTLYHLRSNTPCICDARQPERIKEARQIILDVADGITRQIFPATENQWCAFCDFPEHCPYQKHKYPPVEPVKPEVRKILQGKEANEIVEQYAALQAQKKAIEDQLDTVKQMICDYCEAGGYNRLYGGNHTVTYKIVERTGFSEDKVKALLEPAGLWPRVLKFDPAIVKTLLEVDYLNAELKSKLESLKQVTSSFPQLSVKKLKGEENEDL